MYSELYIKKIVSLRVWNIDWNKVKKAGVQILNFLDFLMLRFLSFKKVQNMRSHIIQKEQNT